MDDIDRYLLEDLGKEGDITSNSIFTEENGCGHIISRQDCVVAGLSEAKQVFEKTGSNVKLMAKDSDRIFKNSVVVKVQGSLKSILTGERLALNFISRMSGIATETRILVDKCQKINPKVRIAATRKTTPGFRKYEKKAVMMGGGEPHRYGLYDAVLIKDNHIKATGSIVEAINKVKNYVTDKIIEVEVENETDALAAAKMGVDAILIDNLDPKSAEFLAKQIRQVDENILIEVSGGINQNNIIEYAIFADRISLGCITHSIKSIDFSLDII
ncbi:MAG: carboxylating nicotinate-nucleotide diphosphorylase [Candidatus Thermoplasmatota archaeon]|nr:carboxylating nicotinate-nucleotide diphosphorylase [Candidatus Thermoplasmatota archaeon]